MRGSRDLGILLGGPVPATALGVCHVCHGLARDGRSRCWCCRAVRRALGDDARDHPLVPMALFTAGDPLYAVLRGYKDAAAVDARRHFAGRLAAHVDVFLEAHAACIEQEAGAWDAVAIVPSSAQRRGPARPGHMGQVGGVMAHHPLTAVVDHVGVLSGLARVELTRGEGSVDHLAPQRRAFVAPNGARRRRVLLLDDTWVTGARMASAAVALEDAGATVVAEVVAGRLVRALGPWAQPRAGTDVRTGDAGESSGTTAVPCCLWCCRWRRPDHPAHEPPRT
jgi:predicted amidophosphoribosyltransferase